MRFYTDFAEAHNEIRRDLAELGVKVQPETMQDIYVADRPEFETTELQNYAYTVENPEYALIENAHWDWVKAEWEDRLVGSLNPGHAWKERPEVWEKFIEGRGRGDKRWEKFSYTYSERMGGDHIEKVVDELRIHPNSRQLWLPVWYPNDENRRGDRRVPCSLGYWFVNRGGALHVTYIMRSCDFATHWPNDIALASLLLHHVAQRAELKVGQFTQFIGSFHVYQKDVADVF